MVSLVITPIESLAYRPSENHNLLKFIFLFQNKTQIEVMINILIQKLRPFLEKRRSYGTDFIKVGMKDFVTRVDSKNKGFGKFDKKTNL